MKQENSQLYIESGENNTAEQLTLMRYLQDGREHVFTHIYMQNVKVLLFSHVCPPTLSRIKKVIVVLEGCVDQVLRCFKSMVMWNPLMVFWLHCCCLLFVIMGHTMMSFRTHVKIAMLQGNR